MFKKCSNASRTKRLKFSLLAITLRTIFASICFGGLKGRMLNIFFITLDYVGTKIALQSASKQQALVRISIVYLSPY